MQSLLALGQQVPLPVFTAAGSLIEEIISPLPSQGIMLFAGSLARSAHAGQWMLFFMALTGAFGKTLGCYIYYFFADKIEDKIMPRFGKYFGITHEQLERVGKRLGKGWADDVALFLLRLIPAVPSSPVSVACGLIKLNIRTFLWTAFAGSFLRNWFYLLIGYFGWEAVRRFIRPMAPYAHFWPVLAGLAGLIALYFGYRFWRKYQAGK